MNCKTGVPFMSSSRNSQIDLINSGYIQFGGSGSTNGPTSISINLNPLNCLRCGDALRHPLLLQCHHAFCTDCLRPPPTQPDGVSSECPLCRHTFNSTEIIGRDSAPATTTGEELIRFLVDSASERAEPCANCEQVLF